MAMRQFKNWACGTGAVVSMLVSFSSQAETLSIAVAANFANPLKDIIAAYKAETGSTDTITYVSNSTGVLEAQIIAGGLTGPYDLFLAANTAAPQDLATNHPELVFSKKVFTYAKGFVTLWTRDGSGIDISAGLPVDFYNLYGAVAIANPPTAPYGAAAWAILQAAPYNLTSLTDPSLKVYSNIDLTYTAVLNGTNQVGFVAKSQVCHRDESGAEVFTGFSHYVYPSQIIQAGVKLNHTGRTKAGKTLLNDFTSYLLAKNGSAATIIGNYCYKKTN